MQIIRKSPLTGKIHALEIPVTEQQLSQWKGGQLIQEAMPDLTADQREFVMSGITREEWMAEFGDEDA